LRLRLFSSGVPFRRIGSWQSLVLKIRFGSVLSEKKEVCMNDDENYWS
jgi:hypothetical protein